MIAVFFFHWALALASPPAISTTCTPRDIACSDEGVVIQLRGVRPRRVLMLRTWEKLLTASVEGLGPDSLVFGVRRTARNINSVNGFIAGTRGNRPQITMQRLRATWMIHHLTVGTPFKVLMQAAGINSLEPFARFLPFVPEADPAHAAIWLRGGES